MTEGSTEYSDPFVISCKAPQSLTNLVERAVREHPVAFPNKSTLVRKAIILLLKEIGYIQREKARRLLMHEPSRASPVIEPVDDTHAVDERE